MTLTVELTGCLGCDPRIRLTQPKSFQLSPSERPHDVHLFCYGPHRPLPDPEGDLPIEADAEIEITRPPREFAALSVATHHRGQTVWHQLRAFNIDPDHPQTRYRELFAVRLARKGDRVHLIGRAASWRTPEGEDFRYLELQSFRIVVTKRPAAERPAR